MAASDSSSLFAHLQEHMGGELPVFEFSKVTLTDLSHSLEDLVLRSGSPAVIFTGFQENRYWDDEAERYRALADVAQQVCIFVHGPIKVPNEEFITISLADDSPLRLEWFLLVLTEQFSALLCAQDLKKTTDSEASRTFNTTFTFAPDAIQQAIDLLLPIVEHHQPNRINDLRETVKHFRPGAPQGDSMTNLIAMMMNHAQERHSQLQAALMQQQQLQVQQERLQQTLVEVAVPVIPLIPGVLVMPLVGHIDARRSQQVMETLLEGIATQQADVAILDITGVPVVDTGVANNLLLTVKAANLLGTSVILTGIGTDIAQTLVHLEVDFSNMQTCATLQSGIEEALTIQGLRISPVDRNP